LFFNFINFEVVLKFTVNELSQSEKETSIELSYEEIKSELDAEVKKEAKKIQLPGFRKGKVPANILKSRFGDALEYEASEKVATQQFWKVAKDNELKPIGTPVLTDIQFNPGKDLNFKVKFEIIPIIDPKDYTDLEIKIPDYVVSEHEVEHELEHILKSNSTTEDVDVVGDGEFFIIKVDLQRITENGEPFAGSKPETLDIDLSNHRVQPDIRESAKGKKVGESFTFAFNDERTNKNGEGSDEKVSESFLYKAELKDIKKIVLPELNEELVKKISKDKVTSPQEFKEEIRKDFTNYYNQRTEEFIHRKLMSSIVSNNEFKPPSSLVQNVLQELIKQEEENGKRMGMKNTDKNILKERLLPSAEFEVKWYLLKNLIQKKENLKFSEEELNDLAAKDAEKTGLAIDKLINYYKSSNVTDKLVDKKLFDFLKEKNNIVKVAPENLS
ncbi:MAG TPA: trigger factor, partial [Ignavibacteriales bacterium]|nr:trigger factor [Ignavibacteriales bacterium]